MEKVSSTTDILDNQSVLLFWQNYAFKILKPQHKKTSTELLANQFNSSSPFNTAFYKSNPLNEEKKIQIQRGLWSKFTQISNSFSNNLSVGCFDTNNGQLIGAAVAKKNISLQNDEEEVSHQEVNQQEVNLGTVVVGCQQELIKNLSEEYKYLCKLKNKVMDIYGVAIRKDHGGKGILQKMMALNQQLAAEQNMEYSFVWSSNFKTSKTVSKLGYKKISEINCKLFQLNGVKHLQMIDEENQYSSLWLKKIKQG